jgi:hypothetical protein
MKTKISAVLAMFLFSCASVQQPADPVAEYESYILEWQEKIERDGWSERQVDEIVAGCVRVMGYDSDQDVYGVNEHWPTVKELKAHGMKDDCDGFAALMFSTLKRLEYPHRVRLQAVKTWYGLDHAMLNVEMEDGWKRYNPVPMPGAQIDLAGCRTLFEWDEKNIYRQGDQQ